ncbi:PAS domain-containing protein [Halovenus sp. WSH3]|uniref:histidine kinase n=1 Tax=Halovenus carboxidivorans TaxID=2692199 RepID=A0A6B0SWM6_9EURY|nr:PAS domain-containing protein [Halovenus carboxidivorans]MXR50088.1 PAS domain-containing protein [Halovenus carboxidivorans]
MPVSRSVTVLHVDDDSNFGDLVQTVLTRERETFEVLTKTDPEQVLPCLDATAVDCVVSDYDLPGMNGLELLEVVRTEYPDLPFILFTGKGTEEVASRAISAGVTDYLQKQGGTDQFTVLANRIENAVESNRHRQEVTETNRQFEAVLETMSAVVFLKDEQGQYLLANDAFRDLFALDDDVDITNITDEDLFPPAQIEKYQADDREVFETGSVVETVEEVPTDDGVQINLTRKSPVYDESGEVTAICGVTTDITEQKRREETIRTLKERFELAVEGAHLGVWDWDLTTDAVEFNEQWAEMLGYSLDDIDPTLDAWERRVHPDDLPAVEEALEAHKNGATEYYDTEHRMRTASGDWKWIRDVGQIFERDDDGTPLRAVGIHIDIDDRKRAERALREERDLFTSGPVVVFRWEQTARLPVNYVSSNVTDVLGYDAEAFLSGRLRFADIVHEEDRGRVLRHQHDGQTGSFTRDPYRVRTKSGGVRWVLSQTVELDGDGTAERIGYLIDVTERQRTEQQLDEYASTFDQLQETTGDLLRATTPEEVAEVAVDSLETVFEFDVACLWLADEHRQLEPVAQTTRGDDLIGQVPTYSADTESLSWAAYDEQTIRKIDDTHAHERRHNPDTSIRSELIVPLGEFGVLNIGSRTTGAFSDRDVTRVDLWADTIQSALARVDQLQQLKRREAELQAERDRLDEFASFVSHDLRNPLSIASLRLELAMEECNSDHLRDAQQALDRMDGFIEDLLTLAKQGDTIGETEPIDLQHLVSRCWSGIESDAADIEIRDAVVLEADRNRLTSLIENLLTNAVTHGPDGVRITVGALPEEAGFYVADDGEGIPEADSKQVFESGYSTDADGTGIGLAIVEQIADAHGWDVRLTASETGGARFEITGVELVDE